jgi:RNA polymerase sigma-70 factor (ECF subfamily)
MDTEELVIEAQAGNAAALNRLLAVWRPRLVRRALALVRSEGAAQDVVQETLIRLTGNLGNLANPAAFASWAYTILQRAGAEYYRRERRQRREAVSFDETLAQPASLDRQHAIDVGQELEACVEQLGTADRDLIRLHYWGGLELKEIGRSLGVATGAVKTRLFRARVRLAGLLGDASNPSGLATG